MKTSVFWSTTALLMLALAPASASEGEYTYNEFEINDLPEEQEAESLWEFSVGVESVYGKSQTDGIISTYVYDRYWDSGNREWVDTSYTARQKIKLDTGGLNFRLNWKREKPFFETVFFPEIFVLGGFMTGKSEGENFWMFQCATGGNLHFPLSEFVSVFGGVRFGLGYLLLDDAAGASDGYYGYSSFDDSDEYATDFGLNYGIGAGIDFRLGQRGGIVRLGVDYLASTTDADAGVNGLSVSKPEWVLFSLSYNATF